MKIINDTLKNNGKWSRKSLTAFVSFVIAVIIGGYIVVSDWFLQKEINRYAIDVFFGFLALSGGIFGLTVIDKIKNGRNVEKENPE